MRRNRTARQHNFAVIPGQKIPRARFAMRQTRKMGFDASDLIPIFCEEVLPGDTWQHNEAVAARLATPIAPLLDDMDLETAYFYVPNRILDDLWEDLITGTDDTLTVPKVQPYDGLIRVNEGSLFDHLGIPPQAYPDGLKITAYPVLAYFEIFNQWYRDQNLQPEWEWPSNIHPYLSSSEIDNGSPWDGTPLRVNKRHDYFTSSLPWPQKGDPVMFPINTGASIVPAFTGAGPSFRITGNLVDYELLGTTASDAVKFDAGVGVGGAVEWNPAVNGSGLTVAGSLAPSLNAIRLASITQKILELDARGGSRYVEQILVQFGVRSPDFRLDRPEYLGGSRIPVTINPIAQTATYDAEPTATESAIGNLGAEMHASGTNRSFTYAATEHGYILGLACVRSTPTYQQGLRRHWLRNTRFDFWLPAMEGLGEQAVDTREIYLPSNNAPTNPTWGYQERGAEYRYTPNEITGPLRSTAATPMDWWHLSEEFGAEPALNAAFITDKTKETLARSLATAPNEQWACQVIMDIEHTGSVARLMPAYGVPGIDRF